MSNKQVIHVRIAQKENIRVQFNAINLNKKYYFSDSLDVSLSSLADRDLLIYNLGLGKWQNKTVTYIAGNGLENNGSGKLQLNVDSNLFTFISSELTINQSTDVQDGYLSKEDWIIFNNKLSNISGQDHSTLANLSYSSSGHTGFQKSIIYDGDYKCLLIEI